MPLMEILSAYGVFSREMSRCGGFPTACKEAVRARARWREDGPPDELLFCAYSRVDEATHPLNAVFKRRELFNGCCPAHAVMNHLVDQEGQLLSTPALIKETQISDGKRGKTPSESDVVRAIQNAKSLLWQPFRIDWQEVKKRVREGKMEETLAPLLEQVGMTREEFDCGPVDDKVRRARRRTRSWLHELTQKIVFSSVLGFL